MSSKSVSPVMLRRAPSAAVLALFIGGILGVLVTGVANPLQALVGGVALVGVIATLYSTEVGILTLAVMTFTRFSEAMSNVYHAPSIITPYTVLVIIALVARMVISGHRPQGWAKTTLLVALYGVVGFASLLWATDFDRAQTTLSDQLKDSSTAIIAVLLVQRGITLRRVAWAIVAVGAFLGTISVYQYITGTYENAYWGFGLAKTSVIVDRSSALEYRIGGPFADSVFYAQLLLLFVPLALDRLWNAKTWLLRGVATYSLGVCLLSIVLTFSRGGFLALALMLGYIMIRRPPPLRAVLICVVVAIPLIALLPDTYTYRLQTIIEYMPIIGQSDVRNEQSFRGRSSEMLVAAHMFSDHPITGVGLGNYNARYLEYSRPLGIDPRLEDRSAHSLYLEIASETGLVGLAVFLLLIGIMFYGLERSYQALKRAELHEYAGLAMAITAGMIGYLAAAIVLHAAFPRPFWFYFGLAMALPNITRYELARKQAATAAGV